jgi:integrase/recombinase XerD
MKWLEALYDYQLYLKIERGLSQNSIDSYSRDLKKLLSFLEENTIVISPINISNDTIQKFIYDASKSINARTQARLISGLRSFFDYLIFENYRTTNPTDQL